MQQTETNHPMVYTKVAKSAKEHTTGSVPFDVAVPAPCGGRAAAGGAGKIA